MIKKYRLRILFTLVFLSGLYLVVRFYVFLKPASVSFPLELKWVTELGYSTYDRPIYQNGLILFPASGLLSSKWYGLEATTGQIVWKQPIPRFSYRRCVMPEYLVVSSSNFLAALNPDSGKFIWQEGLGNVATCSDTTVFAIGNRGFVQALDLKTGQYLWRGTKPDQSYIGLTYISNTDKLIADGAVIVDPASGQILRSFEPLFVSYPPTDQGRGPMLVIDRGQLFIGGSVRDAETGEVLHVEERFSGFAAPTITEDTIYTADAGGHPYPSGVVAIDRSTFAVKWRYQLEHKLPFVAMITLSPVTIFDGIGYVIFSDATLRAFDLETGQELGYWQPGGLDLLFWPGCTLPIPRFPNPIECVRSRGVGMATSANTLFVSFGDGKLLAFGR